MFRLVDCKFYVLKVLKLILKIDKLDRLKVYFQKQVDVFKICNKN